MNVHILSTTPTLYGYDLDPKVTIAMNKECNDEVAQTAKSWPDRFSGFATLPMQDVKAAIAELERSVIKLGLKGAMIDDHVNGLTYDEPQFLPFWKAAEQMGALIFIHQIGGYTVVTHRTKRYFLGNTIGNLADRAITYATLVFWRGHGQVPRLERLPRPRWWLRLLWDRAHGPGMAGDSRCPS